MENRISDESPLGKGLIGGRIDEELDVEIPAGIMRLKILEISKQNVRGKKPKGLESAAFRRAGSWGFLYLPAEKQIKKFADCLQNIDGFFQNISYDKDGFPKILAAAKDLR